MQKEKTAKRRPLVAPARERGLKCLKLIFLPLPLGRSREGAWIEICAYVARYVTKKRRSREGAWIEITIIKEF